MEAWDHFGDALIVVSAGRVRGTVVSPNDEHLEIWAEMARASGRDVLVRRLRA